MKFSNKYLWNLKPYKLASHLIWKVKPQERKDILKLDWNEATIPPTPLVKQMIQELIEEPMFFNLYPTTQNEELTNLLAQYVQLPKDNIQYFCSSDALHEYICKVFLSVGNSVVILGPSYDNFRLTCQANGAEVFWSNYTNDFRFDKEQFESDIANIKPAVVYICNPNNPTGHIHSVEYIRHLLDKFPDSLFLIDEAYQEFSGITAKELVLEYDNILISRTMSKAFALANFRIGYLIASKENVDIINRIRNPKNLTTFAQTAAIAALKDLDYTMQYVKEVNNTKNWFMNQLENLFADYMTPYNSAGNFMMIEFPDYEKKSELLHYLSEERIFVRDCTQGLSVRNCFRITIGTLNQMKVVIDKMRSFYAK